MVALYVVSLTTRSQMDFGTPLRDIKTAVKIEAKAAALKN
jgi:hypothetical protein